MPKHGSTNSYELLKITQIHGPNRFASQAGPGKKPRSLCDDGISPIFFNHKLGKYIYNSIFHPPLILYMNLIYIYILTHLKHNQIQGIKSRFKKLHDCLIYSQDYSNPQLSHSRFNLYVWIYFHNIYRVIFTQHISKNPIF